MCLAESGVVVAETLSKVRTDTPPASPAPKPGMSGGWRALGVAGAAIAAVVGVTGGILGIVAFTAESSAPQLLPPGPHELGGRVETLTETNAMRCPDAEKAQQMEQLVMQVKADGDTIGGIITCVIKGCPVGLGEPEFDKLHA